MDVEWRERPQDRTNANFQETNWTTIVDVARDAGSPSHEEALERLCRSYWPPIYAVLRKTGHTPPDSEDLCQGFFAHLLRNKRLSRPSREQGKFRSWLLVCLKHYLHNEHDRRAALMRNPHGGIVSLEDVTESDVESQSPCDVDLAFDSEFAHQLVNSVLAELRTEYKRNGALVGALEPCLTTKLDGDTTKQIAERFDMSEVAVRVALNRLKTRFGEILFRHVRQLVIEEADVDAELRHLIKAWLSRCAPNGSASV